ncbi:MAG: GTPase [Phycisphaerae bacterium]
MSDSYSDLFRRVSDWAAAARTQGWLQEADVQALAAVETATPTDLFEEVDRRPLMIGFFGGTGVGKSTLINRIAGEEIAQTGIVRPTSHEVTVYIHEDCAIKQLPIDPAAKTVAVKRHRNPAWRDVAWVDTPDVDSTDATNRATTLGWLPYLDLMIYVLSPERYRDDTGWRVLQRRAQRHAWMFVINRSDEGAPGQVEQFREMLGEAGFEDPIVLQTCSKPGPVRGSPDEFEAIREAVRGLLSIHGASELEKLRRRAQSRELRTTLERLSSRLGDEEAWTQLRQIWHGSWETVSQSLFEGVDYSLRYISARFAVREGGWFARATRSVETTRDQPTDSSLQGDAAVSDSTPHAAPPDPREFAELTQDLWDDWADAKLAGALDQLEMECRARAISPSPLRSGLDERAAEVQSKVGIHLQDALRTELANPGRAWQRAAQRVTGFAIVFLPACALCWVLYEAVTGYHLANRGEIAYRGTNFLIDSLVVIALAWAVPFAVDRMLRPSLERGALRALRRGTAESLEDIREAIDRCISATSNDAAALRSEAEKIQKALAGLAVRPINIHHEGIRRMIAQIVAAKSA